MLQRGNASCIVATLLKINALIRESTRSANETMTMPKLRSFGVVARSDEFIQLEIATRRQEQYKRRGAGFEGHSRRIGCLQVGFVRVTGM